jgi:hypothetical protein
MLHEYGRLRAELGELLGRGDLRRRLAPRDRRVAAPCEESLGGLGQEMSLSRSAGYRGRVDRTLERDEENPMASHSSFS